jgi:hypothetical protein
MFPGMTRRRIITNARTEWTPLNTLVRRIAGKLRRQHEEFQPSSGCGVIGLGSGLDTHPTDGTDRSRDRGGRRCGFDGTLERAELNRGAAATDQRNKGPHENGARWRVERAGEELVHLAGHIEAIAANTP